MDGRRLTVLALRVSGVVLLARTCAIVPVAVFGAILAGRGTFGERPGQWGELVIHAAIAVLLVAFSHRLGTWAVPGAATADSLVDIRQLTSSALALVAILLVAIGCRDALTGAWTIAARPAGPTPSAQLEVVHRFLYTAGERVARAIPEIAAGAVLLARVREGTRPTTTGPPTTDQD